VADAEPETVGRTVGGGTIHVPVALAPDVVVVVDEVVEACITSHT